MNKFLKIKTLFCLEFTKIEIVIDENASVVVCGGLFGKLV